MSGGRSDPVSGCFEGGVHYLCFSLKSMGVLLLERQPEPLGPDLAAALVPVIIFSN